MNSISLGAFASLMILSSSPLAAGWEKPRATGAEAADAVTAHLHSTTATAPCRAEEFIVLAQGEIRVPSDTQLERMEERAITRVPLDVTGAPPRPRGGEEAEIRQMDERAHRIDERLLQGGGICADCK
jgi:hypothetical protein